ncbi:hypothetical protein Ciccas_009555 [Cichlidogyrus casuarinus]|uniref:Translation elongation factor EF1B beta/delta subunit guanine nucleotide exchange domain-containing protein n=1 Tax=Cichlidogyrus casuarinus TaxID=1844966 RepID=A0ABD2PXE4_9PLAT
MKVVGLTDWKNSKRVFLYLLGYCSNLSHFTVVDELSAKIDRLECIVNNLTKDSTLSAPVSKDDDDEMDLFGSDDDDENDEKRKAILAAYQQKKSKKPVLIAKSSIILDVKPWDDEVDMKALEVKVREIKTDGLLWGSSKLVDIAFGIKKLQITCVVEDDKVGTDFLEESITAFEDQVQSVDIASFQKI